MSDPIIVLATFDTTLPAIKIQSIQIIINKAQTQNWFNQRQQEIDTQVHYQ